MFKNQFEVLRTNTWIEFITTLELNLLIWQLLKGAELLRLALPSRLNKFVSSRQRIQFIYKSNVMEFSDDKSRYCVPVHLYINIENQQDCALHSRRALRFAHEAVSHSYQCFT